MAGPFDFLGKCRAPVPECLWPAFRDIHDLENESRIAENRMKDDYKAMSATAAGTLASLLANL